MVIFTGGFHMEDKNFEKYTFMGIISIILGIGGILLHYIFYCLYLEPLLDAETEAAQACAATAPYFLSLFADFGFLGGVLWLLAGVGFLQKKKWAYPLAVIGVVLSLKSSFWPNIPMMETKVAVPGPWFLIFLPNLIVYFYLLRSVGKEAWNKIWLGLFTGMAFILNFINGIASTTRMVTNELTNAEIFILTERMNMVASILFGIVTVGVMLSKRKEIIRIIGLAGTFSSIIAGFPLAIYSMFFFRSNIGFSMFIMAPIISTLTGFVFLIPKWWNKIVGQKE